MESQPDPHGGQFFDRKPASALPPELRSDERMSVPLTPYDAYPQLG